MQDHTHTSADTRTVRTPSGRIAYAEQGTGPVAFALVYAIFGLNAAAAVAVGLGVLLIIERLIRRKSPVNAIGGLLVTGIAAFIAVRTGKAETYFVPRALIQLDRPEEAASLALEATGLLTDESPYDAGRGYAVVAGVYAELGDSSKAIEIYELAAERMSSHPSRYLMETYEKLAALLEGSGRQDEALGVLKKAVAIQTQPA